MTSLKKPTLVLLLLAFGVIAGGCSTRTQNGSTIPWSRPASWEGQIPGMGAPTGR